MTEFQLESTKADFVHNGWLSSHALLIWRTDEKGRQKNLIIDGEHRWRIATELGFPRGPMVFLDGLTQKRAQEMTVALDSKRGKFDEGKLRTVLEQIGIDDALAFRLGLDDETFKALTSSEPVIPPEEFSDVSVNTQTQYTCPKCGYEWRGKAGGKQEKKAAGRKKASARRSKRKPRR